MRATLLYSLLLISWSLAGQDIRIQKDYQESFSSERISLLELDNKYGDVIINTWDKDSIVVKVNVEAFGKSQDLVNREIRRADIEIRQVGSLITAVTKFDQGKTRGFFGELLAEIEDVSKTIVGNGKLTIDYEVNMPVGLALNVTNKYGDLYIGHLTSKTKINLSHGDLRGDQLLGDMSLTHSFGKHTIDQVGKVNLSLRGVRCDIRKADELIFESSSSELFLGTIQTLRLDNRNDKILVKEATNVSGKGSFTELTVTKLINSSRLSFNYGEIYLDKVLRNFEFVRIDGKSTDIHLIIDQGSYIKTYLEGVESQMILPNSMLTMSKEDLTDSGRISLSGLVGNTQVEVSDLYIQADQGDLIISIQETDIFTNKSK